MLISDFDKYLHAVLTRAGEEARKDGSTAVEVQHLLLAVAAEGEPTTTELLGLDYEGVRDALHREFEHSLSAAGVSLAAYTLPPPTYTAERVTQIGASAKLALERSFNSVARKRDLRPAHVLLGIVRAEVGTIPRALQLAGIDRTELLTRVLEAL